MGTLVNVVAVLVGGFLGLILKNKISRRFIDQVTIVLGCAVIIMGIVELIPTMIYFGNGELNSHHSMVLIISLVIGYGAGHWLGLARLVDKLGNYLESKVHKEGHSIVYCCVHYSSCCSFLCSESCKK